MKPNAVRSLHLQFGSLLYCWAQHQENNFPTVLLESSMQEDCLTKAIQSDPMKVPYSFLIKLSPKATDDNESASSSLTVDVCSCLPSWLETFAVPWCFWEFQGPVSWSSDRSLPLDTAVGSRCLIKVNSNPRNEKESFQSHFCFC